MLSVNRKLLEVFYNEEWSFLSQDSRSILLELTCQAYELNKPSVPSFIKLNDLPKLQRLGEI